MLYNHETTLEFILDKCMPHKEEITELDKSWLLLAIDQNGGIDAIIEEVQV